MHISGLWMGAAVAITRQGSIQYLWFWFWCAYIELFCWEGSDSHSGGVGLWNPKHITDVQRRDAQTGAGPAHSAVWWCHKRICAWRGQVCVTIEPTPPEIIAHASRSYLYQSQCQGEQRWPLQPEFSLEVHEEIRTCSRPHLWPSVAISQHIPARNSEKGICFFFCFFCWMTFNTFLVCQLLPWVFSTGPQHQLSRMGTWIGTGGRGSWIWNKGNPETCKIILSGSGLIGHIPTIPTLWRNP